MKQDRRKGKGSRSRGGLRSGGGFRGGFRERSDGGARFSSGFNSFSRPQRTMHKAICAECGKECEVPFEPTEGRPVYCRECFAKHRPRRF